MSLRAPFPWFGGKSRAAPAVWAALGDVGSYVEPFAGSLGCLLERPATSGLRCETVNDLDGFVVNFWRALQADPEGLEAWHDWPVTELDLTARHLWLVERRAKLTSRLEADPDYFDLQIAGWWVWGICSWIGSGWCSGDGPWIRDGERVVRGDAGRGVHRQLPHLGNAGMGVHRQLPHLGDAGRGVHRQLAERLRGVRVACGDWSRAVTPSVLRGGGGDVGVFLDPPYPAGEMEYATAGDVDALWSDVTAWAAANGSEYRVVVAGYDRLWSAPRGWTTRTWKARKGYQATNEAKADRSAEVLWCSPACLPEAAPGLFAAVGAP